MTYIRALTVMIQDRINHLSGVVEKYEEQDKTTVEHEIKTLELVLDILVAIDE